MKDFQIEDHDLTQWHSGKEKPVRPGLYQREIFLPDTNSLICWSYWNGNYWGYYERNMAYAFRFRDCKSSIQKASWRGLRREIK